MGLQPVRPTPHSDLHDELDEPKDVILFPNDSDGSVDDRSRLQSTTSPTTHVPTCANNGDGADHPSRTDADTDPRADTDADESAGESTSDATSQFMDEPGENRR